MWCFVWQSWACSSRLSMKDREDAKVSLWVFRNRRDHHRCSYDSFGYRVFLPGVSQLNGRDEEVLRVPSEKQSKESPQRCMDLGLPQHSWTNLQLSRKLPHLQLLRLESMHPHRSKSPLIKSNLQTNILSPIFMVFTYIISFCSTLWLYHQKRISQEESLQISYSQL